MDIEKQIEYQKHGLENFKVERGGGMKKMTKIFLGGLAILK